MNWDILEGQYKELKGKVLSEWALLVCDQRMAIQGKREELIGKLQSRHGIERDIANQKVSTWLSRH